MSKSRTHEPELWTKSSLLDRGWTNAAFKRFYPDPFKTVRNPRYRNAPAMKLYLASKVMVLESTDEFKNFRTSSKKRKISAEKAVETKRKKILQEVSDIDISFKKIDYGKIVQMAIKHYNAWKQARYNDHYFLPATIDSDRCFLDRITVNFIRHRLTDYDKLINSFCKRVGKTSAYRLLCDRIFNYIGEVYPELKGEAMQQLEAKINGSANILRESWFCYGTLANQHAALVQKLNSYSEPETGLNTVSSSDSWYISKGVAFA